MDAEGYELRGGMARSGYIHRVDDMIPEQVGYTIGARAQVVMCPEEIRDEFACDPDVAHTWDGVSKQWCGVEGVITGRSQWGWLLIRSATESEWFTPRCLWLVDSPLARTLSQRIYTPSEIGTLSDSKRCDRMPAEEYQEALARPCPVENCNRETIQAQ